MAKALIWAVVIIFLIGLAVVLTGTPAFYLWSARKKPEPASRASVERQ